MFLNPEKLIEYSDIHHAMKVADFGASVGHYALHIARRVGGQGKVFAIDIQKDLLTKLQSEAEAAKISNIEIIWGDVEIVGGTKLKNDSVDRVLIANILFQTYDKAGLITEAKRILKKGGKVIVIDWTDSFSGLGPHKKDVVNKKMAKDLFESQGFIYDSEMKAGDHHYGIILEK